MHRKRGEAQNNRLKGKFRPEKVNNEGGEKKTNIWSKKNTGLIIRMQKDMEKVILNLVGISLIFLIQKYKYLELGYESDLESVSNCSIFNI